MSLHFYEMLLNVCRVNFIVSKMSLTSTELASMSLRMTSRRGFRKSPYVYRRASRVNVRTTSVIIDITIYYKQ
jgi:hypothetical protein